jgi:hypothetical protein
MELDGVQIQTIGSKGMNVTASLPIPIDELDAELERPLRIADKVVLIETQQRVERTDRRDGRFANTHRTDFIGLDQRH